MSHSRHHNKTNPLKRAWQWLHRNVHRFKVWYKSLYHHKPWWQKTLVAMATAVVCFFLYLVAVDINLLWLFGKSPSTHAIMNPRTPSASYIYSADGVVLGKYYDENRTPVPYDSINPQFFRVLIDTEDERFYNHHGIDFGGIFAAFKDMVLHGKPRGASTITQQLVKNMFRTRADYSTGLLGYIPGVDLIISKSKEWIIATKLEIFYSKQEILEMYANTVDFGANAYGIKTAARTYFNTTPAELRLEQSAVLVGILKATSTYSPIVNPKNSLNRRNVVMHNMIQHGDLTKAAYDSISRLPVTLQLTLESPTSGIAPYFRQTVYNDLQDWCKANDMDLNRDGLKVYTTLDSRMQAHAEQAVSEQMKQVQRNFERAWGKNDCWVDENNQVIPNFVEDKAKNTDVYRQLLARYPNDLDSVNYYMNKPRRMHLFDYVNDSLYMELSPMDSIRYMLHFMHCGFIAMEPQTGYVRAWVGDVDFDIWKYDKVTSKHQPGSTFKVFDYSMAMERGLTPIDTRPDTYIDTMVYDEDKMQMVHWRPTNANGRFSGRDMTLRSAFAMSTNSVAVRVSREVGFENIAQIAAAMGIHSPLKVTPALSLGASDVDLRELVNAYGTIINEGVQRDPVMVTRIVDSKGRVVYQAPNRTTRAMSYRAAFLMQQMLKAVCSDPNGTGQGLNRYISGMGTEYGGKTGTSNRHADAWFVAVTPRLVCGTWIGGEYRQIHFLGYMGQGSKIALPVCGRFLQLLLQDPRMSHYRGNFPPPREYIDPVLYEMVNTDTMPDSTGLALDSLRIDSLALPPEEEEILVTDSL